MGKNKILLNFFLEFHKKKYRAVFKIFSSGFSEDFLAENFENLRRRIGQMEIEF